MSAVDGAERQILGVRLSAEYARKREHKGMIVGSVDRRH